ncbi:hypothetical protein K2173_023716 [Erythroxylum novogranatense]|uniref:Reverse transcriptase domain-containing protein n=1 Tax=Erythroxylum novogranatense TaxID=1862640 RepID=A0AAV8TPJ9_9ROSI|nr:hypothetical protein K2173_023716 [Erythroxylum novogranatense]
MPMELEAPVHDNPVFVLDRKTEDQRGAINGERFRKIISMTQFQASKMGSSLDPKQNSVVRMEENCDPKEVLLPHSNRKWPKKAKSTVTVSPIISQVVKRGRPKDVRKVSQVKKVVGDAESSAASACVSEAVEAMIRIVDNLQIEMSAISGSSLQDIGFNGPQFTWCWGSLFQKLNRVVVNGDWEISFPNTSVTHLERLKFDHLLLLISFGGSQSHPRDRPFRFFSGWLEHESFAGLVKDKWDDKLPIAHTVYQFTEAVKAWNKAVFGSFIARKRTIIGRISGVQKALERRSNPRLVQLEIDLQAELEEILDNEEILWRQKSRCEWLADGERNTKYYHGRTMTRRRRNKISALRLQDNSWCYDDAMLKQEAIDFFSNLYTMESQPPGPFPDRGYFSSISRPNFERLQRQVMEDEIKLALMDMYLLKAPGVDGINAQFYQRLWQIVGPSICSMVRGVFSGQNLEPVLNRTLLVLILKMQGPKHLAQFRPISLCSVLYQLITKTIANRLKSIMPDLIAQNQVSFVAGRSINDNIIVAQEVIHSMKGFQGQSGWMAIKVDLEKAYDRVRWDFLQDTLIDVGLPLNLIRIIMICVSTSSIQVLWNRGGDG